MKKCVHVTMMDGYQPEMCKLTIPNLRAYAERIGADFNLITKPMFGGFPPNYERFQIFFDGRDYDWNINLDADTVLHHDFPDVTEICDPQALCSLYGMQANFYFDTRAIPFIRDGRNQAVADQFTVTSRLVHDVWEPLRMPFEEMSKLCLKEPRQVSEYNLSYNMARFGIRHNGIPVDYAMHYSLMVTTDGVLKPEDQIAAKLEEWKVK